MTATADSNDSDRRQLRRLVLWNRLWIAAAVLLTLGLLGGWVIQTAVDRVNSLRVSWTESGDLRFRSISDGPFIVTHLLKVEPVEPTPSVAKLREPIVIIDSAGAVLKRTDFENLNWFSYLNEPHPRAAVGTEVIAFYYRPLRTGSSMGNRRIHPEGVTAVRRWSSEASPPESGRERFSTPEGLQT